MTPERAAASLAAGDTINGIAARQYGVVSRRQLIAAGLSGPTLRRVVRAGFVRVLHRGVYAVGPVLVPRAREMAAVLACGEASYVSYRSAGALHEVLPAGVVDAAAADAVSVSLAAGYHRRPGIRVHRVRALPPDETTVLGGIPVTNAARTLIDLAAIATARELEWAVAEALARSLTDRDALLHLLNRHRRRPGARRLRRLLGGDVDPARTRSEAEARFRALIETGQLPTPRVNVVVHGYEVDFFWPAQRFVVEIDGYAFHSSTQRFDADRRRDAVLYAAGVHVQRVTWQQLTGEPCAVLVRVAQALALAGSRR